MSFERACLLDDVPTDEAVAVTIGRYDVAVARFEGDGDDGSTEVFAVQDLCSHQAVALSEGEVSTDGCAGPSIECWLHGSTFDLRSGKPTCLPATEPISTFPVEVRTEAEGPVVYVDTTTTLNGVNPT